MIIHILAACALMPVAGHPYDIAALTGSSGAWLRWGVPLFYHSKFGFDLSTLGIGAQSLSFVLEHLGMSGAAALAIAWKLPFVLADLLVAAILIDIGRQLGAKRPALIPTLWLISPASLWVSAGHGQVESLTILAIVLSLDLLLRSRPLLAGIVGGWVSASSTSSLGYDRRHLLALCLCLSMPGALPLHCRLCGRDGFLFRAITFNLSRPHEPPGRAVLYRNCYEPFESSQNCGSDWLISVDDIGRVTGPLLA